MANSVQSQNLIEVKNDQLDKELSNAGTRLVVVDFTATWCGPCQRIGPHFVSYAKEYTDAVFLKCDVDENPNSSAKYGVRAMPTFMFFRSKAKFDEYKGSREDQLKAKLDQWYTKSDNDGSSDDKSKNAYMELTTFIDKRAMECLNQTNEHDLEACLAKGDGYLESDCDEQLIINIGFTQNVKLHSLKINGPLSFLPKNIKIFTNLPNTIDFDTAERSQAVQELELTKENFEEDVVIPLRFVKFQNVSSVTLYIKDNQGCEDTTKISQLVFIGVPVNTTNMAEFKRIAGKKGESH